MYRLPENKLAVKASGYKASFAAAWSEAGLSGPSPMPSPSKRRADGMALEKVGKATGSRCARRAGRAAQDASDAAETATRRARITAG